MIDGEGRVTYQLMESRVQGMDMEQNIKKCMGCKFGLYFENEKRERCSIKVCWDNSKYVPFSMKENDEPS